MEMSEKISVLFDGDQKKISSPIDLLTITPIEQNTSAKLTALIKKQTGCEIKFHLDGGNHTKELKEKQTSDLAKKYLKYYKENVFYLPQNIPEDIIWDEEFATNLLKLLHPTKDLSTIIKKATNAKDLIFNFCQECYGETSQYESTILQFTTNWLNKEDDNYLFMCDLINKLKK